MEENFENQRIRSWRNMSFGTKLFLGIGILVVFIVIMAATINYQVVVLRKEVDTAIEVNVEQVKLATLAKQAFMACYGTANKYLDTGDRNDKMQYEQSAKELNNYLQSLLELTTEKDLLIVTGKEDGSRDISTKYNDLLLAQIKTDQEAGNTDTNVYNIYEELTAAIEAHEQAVSLVKESYVSYDEAKESSSSSSSMYGTDSIYGGYAGGDSYGMGGMGDYGGGGGFSLTDSFLMSPAYFEDSSTVGNAINNIKDWAESSLKEAQVKVNTIQGQVRSTMLILILIGALVALTTTFVLSRSITKPITMIRDQLDEIAEGGGDLSKRIEINSFDEAGQLANAFNNFVASLQEMIRTIAGTANEVAKYSYDLSLNSKDAASAIEQIVITLDQVAEGASTQSKNSADTVSAMNQLQGAIDQIAKGAQEQAQAVSKTGDSATKMSNLSEQVKNSSVLLAEVAGSTEKAAENGREAVKEVVSGMDRIKNATKDVGLKVDELGKYSGEIGKIIAVIDEIADQTSLLALNAAIEAARAGEHGKGFAVVADEVRNLSDRSRNATKEIGTLIKEIQNSISVAVESMDASTVEVALGSDLAGKAQSSLIEILTAVEQTNDEIRKVMSVAQDMALGSQEVAEAIDRVAAVVEENTASSEEMAAGSAQVMTSMESIAAISEQSAAGVEEVTASTEGVNLTIQDIAKSAKILSDASDNLKGLVDKFQV